MLFPEATMPEPLHALRVVDVRVMLDLVVQRAERNHAVMAPSEPTSMDAPRDVMDRSSSTAH